MFLPSLPVLVPNPQDSGNPQFIILAMSGIPTPSLKALLAINSILSVKFTQYFFSHISPVNNVTSHNCRIFRRPGGSVILEQVFSAHSRND